MDDGPLSARSHCTLYTSDSVCTDSSDRSDELPLQYADSCPAVRMRPLKSTPPGASGLPLGTDGGTRVNGADSLDCNRYA